MRPASVGASLREVRSISRTPSRSSRRASRREATAGDRSSRRAAADRLPSSSARTKISYSASMAGSHRCNIGKDNRRSSPWLGGGRAARVQAQGEPAMSTPYVRHGSLNVAAELDAFVRDEASPGTGVTAEAFWAGLEGLLAEYAARNRALLARR